MSEAKHTPGPWAWKVGDIGNPHMLLGQCDLPEYKGPKYAVPVLFPDLWGNGESGRAIFEVHVSDSNAELITKACLIPEFVAVLKELLAAPNKHRPDKLWEQARELIVKAEEESHEFERENNE